jgi:hypothetical protein
MSWSGIRNTWFKELKKRTSRNASCVKLFSDSVRSSASSVSKVRFCYVTMTSATAASQNGACIYQCNHLTNVRYIDLVSQRRNDKSLNFIEFLSDFVMLWIILVLL